MQADSVIGLSGISSPLNVRFGGEVVVLLYAQFQMICLVVVTRPHTDEIVINGRVADSAVGPFRK